MDVVTTLEFLIINVEIWLMLLPMPFLWQILLPLFCVLADVIAMYVEDGKPHFLCLYFWQMLLPWWQMEWPPRIGDDWQML